MTLSTGKTWRPDFRDPRRHGVDVISHTYTADPRKSGTPSLKDYIRPKDIGHLYIRRSPNVSGLFMSLTSLTCAMHFVLASSV
jgi:hypothetical protein